MICFPPVFNHHQNQKIIHPPPPPPPKPEQKGKKGKTNQPWILTHDVDQRL